ncbi:MAG: histidinol-phosphate transaminase, partial [Candidatus Omnitrophica bacterium]|nr:histidinol-phosphate transaminase [Candidatus Omnitrophota bacterium]
GRPIEEIKRLYNIKSVIKLASNENSLGPSKKAIAAIKKNLLQIHRYPDGGCYYLKQKLAKKLKVKPGNLVFGCGSDEIIVLALRAFVGKGDEVVIARPTFLIYELASTICGAKIKFVPLKGLRYDLPAMKKAITKKTKLVFIANPDNPTGTYVTKKEVQSFMKGLPKGVLVFFDEAYYELVDKKDYPNAMKYLGRGNAIVARTFSKAYGLSGLRIGYAITNSHIASCLDKAREPFNVTSLAQVAACAALDDEAHIRLTRKMLKAGKRYLYSQLCRLGIPYIESAANFILVKVGPKAQGAYKRLLKKGVIVRNMSSWGLNEYIRVTIGTMPQNRLFIKSLKTILRNYGG